MGKFKTFKECKVSFSHQSDQDVRHNLAALRYQAQSSENTDGHLYDGDTCLLCGHLGPHDDPEPCHISRLKAEVERLMRLIKDGFRVANALTLETQTPEDMATDLVRQVREARQQRDAHAARAEKAEAKLGEAQAQKVYEDTEKMREALEKAEAEVERLRAVARTASAEVRRLQAERDKHKARAEKAEALLAKCVEALETVLGWLKRDRQREQGGSHDCTDDLRCGACGRIDTVSDALAAVKEKKP